ncbi:MAG: cation diffusion facilitator family transporter, partial [Bdellovibrionota bacterium]
MNDLSCKNDFIQFDETIRKNSGRVQQVLVLNTVIMFLEIYFGYISGSMSLLADGWHMATHAAALGISLLTYKLATSTKMTRNFNFGGGKIIALGGFTSSLFLLLVAVLVFIESFQRFLRPEVIEFQDAIWIAMLGLIVNFIGAYLLRPRSGSAAPETSSHAHHSHSGHASHHHSHSGP